MTPATGENDLRFATYLKRGLTRYMNPTLRTFACLLIVFIWQLPLLGAEKYYIVTLSEIGFTEANISELSVSVTRFARTHDQVVRFPDISLENEVAQAYIALPGSEEDNQRWWGGENQSQLQVALKLPNNQPVSGKALLAGFGSPMKLAYEFKFDPSQSTETTEEAFETARKSYYTRLAQSVIPGGDWFRYQAGDAYRTDARAQRWRNLGEFDSSFNMFTGQRAVSENLALDRELILGTSKEGKPVQIDTIEGVTVSPIDWSERIADTPTPIDPLAMVIPHDQHVAFFRSIKDLNTTIRTVEQEGVSFFQTQSNRKVYEGLAKKYQKQMGILIPDMLAEQLPVKSVAITGGDPFLPSGSDVCVIFETDNPDALLKALHIMIKAQAKLNGGNMSTESTFDGASEYGYRNYERSFSSILLAGDGYVAVANSRTQLSRLKSVTRGDTPSLGSTEEFKFFRQRYPLADEATALIFLSDATIRRWAGPAFRIGASRRVRAAAALGHATAQLIDGVKLEQPYTDLVGELTQSGHKIHSETFNTLNFLTPTSELDIDTVTAAEKEGYVRWRNGYESGWVRFDPIALSLSIDDSSLGLDLSVIPLRIGSEYNEWIRVAGDASLDKVAATPHPESILMLSYAIDSSSETFKMANSQSSSMLPGIGANPLAWVGGSLSLFLDADPFWEAMNASEDPEDYIEDNLAQLPVGLRVSSKSPLKLALFLTTLRSFSEQAAPGLLLWETREHEETPYVVIKTTERAGLPDDMEIKVHYAALPDAFLLSLNEDVLKRAMTRNQAESKSTEPNSAEPYQAFAQAKLSSLKNYLSMMDGDPLPQQQYTSWAALPILNEWHMRFPDQDPVEVHSKYFQERINCPGGQGYQWNAEIGSMESVAFGSPQAPRGEAQHIPLLDNWIEAKAGLSLKDSELRVKAELTK